VSGQKSVHLELSVLLIKEEDKWVAQCLDYDIAAQGETLDAARSRFARTFVGQVMVDLHHHQEPLEGIKPAPRKYWAMFRKAARLAERDPIYFPETTPPPFAISAAAHDMRVM